MTEESRRVAKRMSIDMKLREGDPIKLYFASKLIDKYSLGHDRDNQPRLDVSGTQLGM